MKIVMCMLALAISIIIPICSMPDESAYYSVLIYTGSTFNTSLKECKSNAECDDTELCTNIFRMNFAVLTKRCLKIRERSGIKMGWCGDGIHCDGICVRPSDKFFVQKSNVDMWNKRFITGGLCVKTNREKYSKIDGSSVITDVRPMCTTPADCDHLHRRFEDIRFKKFFKFNDHKYTCVTDEPTGMNYCGKVLPNEINETVVRMCPDGVTVWDNELKCNISNNETCKVAADALCIDYRCCPNKNVTFGKTEIGDLGYLTNTTCDPSRLMLIDYAACVPLKSRNSSLIYHFGKTELKVRVWQTGKACLVNEDCGETRICVHATGNNRACMPFPNDPLYTGFPSDYALLSVVKKFAALVGILVTVIIVTTVFTFLNRE